MLYQSGGSLFVMDAAGLKHYKDRSYKVSRKSLLDSIVSHTSELTCHFFHSCGLPGVSFKGHSIPVGTVSRDVFALRLV